MRFSSLLTLLLALALIGSFGFHGIIEHDHQSAVYGEGISAALHSGRGETEPVSTPLILVLLSFCGIFCTLSARRIRARGTLGRIFNLELLLLRSGILNPKPH